MPLVQIRPFGGAVEISFAYPDRAKAQAVTQALAARFVQQNQVSGLWRANRWRDVWPQEAPPLMKIDLLEPASLPASGAGPNRLAFAAIGLGAGLLLGFALAFRRLAFFAVCGLALGAAVSFLVPAVYTSTAVVRFTQADVPERLAATIEPVPASQRFVQLEEQVLGGVPDPTRKRIAIRDIGPLHFSISCSAADPRTAQAMVRQLVTRFAERNVQDEMAVAGKLEPLNEVRLAYEHRLGPNFEVLDPASLPQAPVSPNRAVFAAAGVLLGLLASIAARHRRARAAVAP